MNIKESLEKIFSSEPSSLPEGLRNARISVEAEEHYSQPEDAMAAFLQPQGEGWLLTVESPQAYVLPDSVPGEAEYPISGEKVLEEESVSLRLLQDGSGGWKLTRLKETSVDTTATEDNQPFVRNAQHLARDKSLGKLTYQVCHEPDNGNSVYKSSLSRFIGFKK